MQMLALIEIRETGRSSAATRTLRSLQWGHRLIEPVCDGDAWALTEAGREESVLRDGTVLAAASARSALDR
jgi:hypothetical protein